MIAPTSTAQLITRQNLDQRKELARQQLQDLYQQQQVQQQELDNRVANTPIGGINQHFRHGKCSHCS